MYVCVCVCVWGREKEKEKEIEIENEIERDEEKKEATKIHTYHRKDKKQGKQKHLILKNKVDLSLKYQNFK